MNDIMGTAESSRMENNDQQIPAPERAQGGREMSPEAYRHSLAVLQTLFDSASDAMVVVASDGRIVLVNAQLEEIFGYDRRELIGQPVEHLLPTDRREIHVQHRTGFFAQPHSRPRGQGHGLAGQRRDGTHFPAEVSLSFIELDDDVITLGIIMDITKQVQAEEALRQHALELQRHNDDLDAFAHTVAHDLKAPLSHVTGFAELLEEGLADLGEAEVRRYLNRITRNVRKMSNIVDELLLLAQVRRIEEMDLIPLDMARIVDHALWRSKDLIEEYQAEIVKPMRDSWPSVMGHGPWVEEVWVNYLSNAIQYGGRPPRVVLGAQADKDGCARFWVRDNGEGLTTEEQARLFTPFTRLDQIRAKGHGLGLSIVRRIVEKLGGQVGVESQVGSGSSFSFTLLIAGQ